MSEVIESPPPNRPVIAQPAERDGVQAAQGESKEFPRWLRQLDQLLPICSQFLAEGNIRDVQLIRSEDGCFSYPLSSACGNSSETEAAKA